MLLVEFIISQSEEDMYW